MTSLSVDDLTGRGKTSLEGHLKANDFFSVSDFNYSELKLNAVKMVSENEYIATGDLTIKGRTHKAEVSFRTEEGSKNMKASLKWVHVARCELTLKLDGTIWLKIIFKTPPDIKSGYQNQKMANA
mgnify:CR=1 FL=1